VFGGLGGGGGVLELDVAGHGIIIAFPVVARILLASASAADAADE